MVVVQDLLEGNTNASEVREGGQRKKKREMEEERRLRRNRRETRRSRRGASTLGKKEKDATLQDIR